VGWWTVHIGVFISFLNDKPVRVSFGVRGLLVLLLLGYFTTHMLVLSLFLVSSICRDVVSKRVSLTLSRCNKDWDGRVLGEGSVSSIMFWGGEFIVTYPEPCADS
jgi:hypothetical protein